MTGRKSEAAENEANWNLVGSQTGSVGITAGLSVASKQARLLAVAVSQVEVMSFPLTPRLLQTSSGQSVGELT